MATVDIKEQFGRFAATFTSDPHDGQLVYKLMDLCNSLTFDALKELRDDIEFLGYFDTFYDALTNYVSHKMASNNKSHDTPVSHKVMRAILLSCSFKRYTESVVPRSIDSTAAPVVPSLNTANSSLPFLTTMAWNQWLLGGTNLPDKPCYYELPLNFKINIP